MVPDYNKMLKGVPYKSLYKDLLKAYQKKVECDKAIEAVEYEYEEDYQDTLDTWLKGESARKRREALEDVIKLEDQLRITKLLKEAVKSKHKKGKYNTLSEAEIRWVACDMLYGNNRYGRRTILTVENLLELTYKTFNAKKKYKSVSGKETAKLVEKWEKMSDVRLVMTGHGAFDSSYNLDKQRPVKIVRVGKLELRRGKIKVPKGIEFHFYCPAGIEMLDQMGHIIEYFTETGQVPEPYEIVREGEYIENYYLGYPHGLTLKYTKYQMQHWVICEPRWQQMTPLTEILKHPRCKAPKEIHWVACRQSVIPGEGKVTRRGKYLRMGLSKPAIIDNGKTKKEIKGNLW